MPIFYLSDKIAFPPPSLATKEGLLAVGGDLSEKRLLLAYQMGIFPWYSKDEPILWWSPDPRMVLFPKEITLSKRLQRTLKKQVFQITFDEAFGRVIRECAAVRLEKQQGTWLVQDMIDAYCRLHESGYAHSVEAWKDGELAGGLYGVSLGKCFFGESMFTRISNGSKAALAGLAQVLDRLSFDMIDCQVKTSHLSHFGAKEIPRSQYLNLLEKSLKFRTLKGKWRLRNTKGPYEN